MEKKSTASVGPAPPPTAVEDTAPVDDAIRPKSLKSLQPKDVAAGGGGKGLGTFAAAFGSGSKPGNFFELLAAAISATKLEHHNVPDFIEYLKKSGVKLAWIRAVVALYEEQNKPDDPLAYILKLMGLGIPDPIDVKLMQDQVTRLRVKLLNLQAENFELREAVKMEEEALQKKEELVSLFEESKFFSEYNSDDDYTDAEEMQQHFSYTKHSVMPATL